MIVSIDLSSRFYKSPSLALRKLSTHLRSMPSATDFFSWLNSAADFAEKHPTITIAVLILFLTFGTPELGPSDKPWIRSRSGLGWLALKMITAYTERTQVFKGLEAEVKIFREQMSSLVARVGESEKVVSWQTQVLMAISSALKIDVLTLLGKDASPVIPVARESVADIGGKKTEKNVDAAPVAG